MLLSRYSATGMITKKKERKYHMQISYNFTQTSNLYYMSECWAFKQLSLKQLLLIYSNLNNYNYRRCFMSWFMVFHLKVER